jgi:hypothetical protein
MKGCCSVSEMAEMGIVLICVPRKSKSPLISNYIQTNNLQLYYSVKKEYILNYSFHS